MSPLLLSLSARRAWIEIVSDSLPALKLTVALRKESVDRNKYVVQCRKTLGVALRKESVDRNKMPVPTCIYSKVALRKESVDRNPLLSLPFRAVRVALRKESVDRNIKADVSYNIKETVALRKESVDRNSLWVWTGGLSYGRSPQGERG